LQAIIVAPPNEWHPQMMELYNVSGGQSNYNVNVNLAQNMNGNMMPGYGQNMNENVMEVGYAPPIIDVTIAQQNTTTNYV